MSAGLLVALVVASAPKLLAFEAPVMGTRVELRIAPRDEAEAKRAAESARLVVEELDRIEALASEWKPSSPIGRVNAAAGAKVVLPEEAFQLVDRALAWSRRTGGAFDPTFASIWGLWRFDPDEAKNIPSRAEAARRAATIDYEAVELDRAAHTVRLAKPGAKIGLGGIAKGYAVDRTVALLRTRGHADFLVKLGGELYLAGMRFGRPWLTGIRHPRDEAKTIARLALKDSAFTTSGDYEHFLIVDGVRYHHIIDPETGYPARGCQSVSIVTARAEDADALSTAVFVMGPVRGMAFVEATPGVEAVIVTDTGEVRTSSGLEGKLLR